MDFHEKASDSRLRFPDLEISTFLKTDVIVVYKIFLTNVKNPEKKQPNISSNPE